MSFYLMPQRVEGNNKIHGIS